MSSRTGLWQAAAFWTIVLACSLLLYSPLLVGESTLYFRDIYHNYYAFLSFIGESLRTGQFPFWNPYVFTGTPQMASLEPPVLYPLGWLFWLRLSFQQALALNLMLHHLLAAGGVYCLGRSYGWRWFTRSLIACLFSFGGVMVAMNNFHPLQNTVAWIPLVFWSLHELLVRPRPGRVAAFALIYGLQVLSGHLEIVYFESLALLIYGGIVAWEQRRLILRAWLAAAFAGLLGVGLSAAQLMPALAYLPYSVRQSGITSSSAQIWSFHPLLSGLFFLPEQADWLQLGVSLHMILGEQKYGYQAFFVSVYTGLTVWVLLCGALLLWRYLPHRGRFGFYGLLAVVGLLMAFGRYFPLYQSMLALPGASFFRYPSKWLIFFDFGLCIAAAWGLEAVLAQPNRAIRLAVPALAISLFGLLGGLGLKLYEPSFLKLLAAMFARWRPDVNQRFVQHWSGLLVTKFAAQLTTVVALSAVLALLWWLFGRQKVRPAAVLTGLLICAVLELLVNGRYTLWLAETHYFETPPPVVGHLRQRGFDRSHQARMILAKDIQNIPEDFQKDKLDLMSFRPMYYLHEAMEDNYSLIYGLRNAYGFSPARSAHDDTLAGIYWHSRSITLRNTVERLQSVRYVVMPNPDLTLESVYAGDERYRRLQDYPDTHSILWENTGWLPRARFQNQALVMSDREQMLDMITRTEPSGYDPGRQVLLLDDAQLALARKQVPPHEALQKRWTQPQLLVDRNSRVEVAFETNTSGYLVLGDQYLPGWEARDNGQAVPILVANYIQRAVRVGPGKHRIVFNYRAPGFAAGLMISLLSLLLLSGLGVWAWLTRAHD